MKKNVVDTDWPYQCVVKHSNWAEMDDPYDWCVENFKEHTYRYELLEANYNVTWFFKNQDDALLFKLRWC